MPAQAWGRKSNGLPVACLWARPWTRIHCFMRARAPVSPLCASRRHTSGLRSPHHAHARPCSCGDGGRRPSAPSESSGGCSAHKPASAGGAPRPLRVHAAAFCFWEPGAMAASRRSPQCSREFGGEVVERIAQKLRGRRGARKGWWCRDQAEAGSGKIGGACTTSAQVGVAFTGGSPPAWCSGHACCRTGTRVLVCSCPRGI